jgi:trans-AT polyketide synthase/acyltransferase/oxidoreductase domain-containing protein
MAQTFKWYFKHSSDLARSGSAADKVNFQVHTGPAIGAFNRWVKGTPLESWRARHVDEMGYAIMAAAEQFIHGRYAALA